MSDDASGILSEARPRVVAALLRAFRDLDTAEDAFQEACVRALKTWSHQGLPRDPVAWLILVGRNVAIDRKRRFQRREIALPEGFESESETSDLHPEARWVEGLDRRGFGDDTLRLFFVCCHPVLTREQQIALALRVVAGLTVPEIARAFLIRPRALEQRLTRAKRKLAAADVAYGIPTAGERASRLPAVLLVIYALFNEGYSAAAGEEHLRPDLCAEAIRLGRILLRAVPSDPEAMGLLALCLLQHARHPARLDGKGSLVLLEDQDRSLWLREPIEEGQVLLEKALRKKRIGPFQVQAAIAATHALARRPEDTDWQEIERLYAYLERLQPTPVVSLNRAVAIRQVAGPRSALEHLEGLERELEGYFPFHGVRGSLWLEVGEEMTGLAELERALALAGTRAEKDHVAEKLRKVKKHPMEVS